MFRRILLIQTAFLGDVVLTTPMIRELRRRCPQAHLAVVVNPGASDILEPNPDVDEVLVIDKKGVHRGPRGMLRFARSVRNREFDLLLSPHQSHRTSVLARLSRIPVRYGYRSAGWARWAYTGLLERPPTEPEIRRLLRFLDESLGPATTRPAELPLLYETDESRDSARALLSELREPRSPILLAPSSVWPTKRWTAYGFARLAALLLREYGGEVLLVGSPADRAVAAEVIACSREINPPHLHERVTNVAGRTSLLGLYSLMLRSKLLVSNDSAPVHFGCAARIPVVALFGPTVASLGYAPIAPGSAVAEIQGLSCRPCGTHGANICPVGHFRCMRDLTPQVVMESVRRVMAEPINGPGLPTG